MVYIWHISWNEIKEISRPSASIYSRIGEMISKIVRSSVERSIFSHESLPWFSASSCLNTYTISFGMVTFGTIFGADFSTFKNYRFWGFLIFGVLDFWNFVDFRFCFGWGVLARFFDPFLIFPFLPWHFFDFGRLCLREIFSDFFDFSSIFLKKSSYSFCFFVALQ